MSWGKNRSDLQNVLERIKRQTGIPLTRCGKVVKRKYDVIKRQSVKMSESRPAQCQRLQQSSSCRKVVVGYLTRFQKCLSWHSLLVKSSSSSCCCSNSLAQKMTTTHTHTNSVFGKDSQASSGIALVALRAPTNVENFQTGLVNRCGQVGKWGSGITQENSSWWTSYSWSALGLTFDASNSHKHVYPEVTLQQIISCKTS